MRTSQALTFSCVFALCVVAACLPPDENTDADGNTSATSTTSTTTTDTNTTDTSSTTSNNSNNNSNTSTTSTSSGDDSCEFALDGECDEPEYCPEGTDTTDCAGQTSTGGTNTGDIIATIPGSDPYTVGELSVSVPDINILSGSAEGFDIDSVSIAVRDETRATAGAWITNTSDEVACFVSMRDVTCTTESGLRIADCMRGFVDGAAYTSESTGSLTTTCLEPGQRGPIARPTTLPSEAAGETIVSIEIRIDARSGSYVPSESRVEVDGEPTFYGEANFRVEATLINNGTANAFLDDTRASVFVLNDRDHILAATFAQSTEDSVTLAPGDTLDVETTRIFGLTVNDDFSHALVFPSWEETQE